jgi:FixJ family two-component response regulator
LDFLEKPFGNELLLTRVGYALDVARKKAKQAALMESNLQKFFSLSSRERDVLRLVVEGHSSKEIARTLGISQRTVDIHRARVMGKMQVTSVAALVRMAAAIL